ncbi:MAG: M48 family metallopeptidase [Candidatus Aenigmarchaeota archaeon]|nr:M48 family metallopeptidase [Candidatus Aenigmarchaeota archaeon]
MKRQRTRYPYEFDPEKRRLARHYTRMKLINKIINSLAVPIVFFAVVLTAGFSSHLRDFSQDAGGVFQVQVYIIIFIALLEIVQFPLSFYSGYVYDRKYSLSRQKLGGWFRDYFKGLGLGYAFMLAAVSFLYYLLAVTPYWWVVASIASLAVAMFISYISPVVLLPLFYKLAPYRDRRQKGRLLDMCSKAGVQNISHVMVLKESEKSSRPNALFSGLGSTKRIVLFDTLLSQFTPAEVETVVAHELGHYVHRDNLKSTIIEAARTFPAFFIINLVLLSSIGLFGIAGIADIAGFPLFMLAFALIEIILMPFINAYSRRCEKAADIFALRQASRPETQVSAEKRLADLHLSDESPHPLVEFFLYSHPAPSKRIKYASEWRKYRKLKRV